VGKRGKNDRKGPRRRGGWDKTCREKKVPLLTGKKSDLPIRTKPEKNLLRSGRAREKEGLLLKKGARMTQKLLERKKEKNRSPCTSA